MCSSYKILNLSLRPIADLDRSKFPTIGKPEYCGGFRLSPEGFFEFERDGSKMIYNQILLPSAARFPLSLSNSSAPFPKKLKSTGGKLCDMLFFIEHTKERWLKADANQCVEVNADVICSRDVLQMFMCAPYEMQNNWSMAVTKYRNTIYISTVKNNKPDSFDNNQMFRIMQDSWLYELKKQCLTGLQEKQGEGHGVFVTDICGLKVVFNAPMITEASPHLNVFAELQLRLDKMTRSEWFEHKRDEAIKWWTNCFLVGIENIYIAARDDDANVLNIQKTPVRDLYKGCENNWAPCVCGNAMVRILCAIKQLTTERNLNCPSTVILFEFEASQGQIIYRILEGRNPYTFVGDWYRNMLNEYGEDLVANRMPTQMAMQI